MPSERRYGWEARQAMFSQSQKIGGKLPSRILGIVHFQPGLSENSHRAFCLKSALEKPRTSALRQCGENQIYAQIHASKRTEAAWDTARLSRLDPLRSRKSLAPGPK